MSFIRLVILFQLGLCTAVSAQKKASVIIFNANIVTLDAANPKAEAIALAGNRILYVGNKVKALSYNDAGTVMVDAKGRTVIPGLFDSHQHVIRGGRFFNAELRWDGITTLKQALTMLKEQAQRTPPGQWVRVVGGWNEYQFKEKRLPTLEEINAATGSTPTFILYLYGKAWLNKAGLKALAIGPDTPNPPAGLIEKDEKGNATGLLVAEPNAFILYSTLSRLPELSRQEKFNSTLQYMRELNSLGLTGVMDAGGGFQNYPGDYDIMDSLYHAGKISLRLPFFLFAQKKGSEINDYIKWSQDIDLEHQRKGTIGHIDYFVGGAGENLVADAADFENFLLPRPELPVSMETNLKAVLRVLVKKKWPFRIHATYNESISRDLAVIEEVNREIPLNGLPWFIDHAETISEDNIQIIKRLGGGIAIQNRMSFQGESFIRRYGVKAAAFAPPVKSMLAAGIPVGLGTDGTRVSSYNPWIALYWITTGKSVGGNQVMSENNTLDRLTALRLLTSGGYSLIKEDQDKGRIKEGYVADIAMLDRDYFSVAASQIPFIRSVLTIVDGKIVYGNAEFTKLAPAPVQIIPQWSPVKYYYQHLTK